jgi:ferritin-like metal-binding protein YciE
MPPNTNPARRSTSASKTRRSSTTSKARGSSTTSKTRRTSTSKTTRRTSPSKTTAQTTTANAQEARELFLHELGDVLTAEKTIAKMLPQMKKTASNAKLTDRITQHEKETKRHVTNVEAVFRALGAKPKAVRCPGIEGIKAEYDEARGDGGSAAITDLQMLGIGARVEHYEIASYEGLVTMAKAMGESKAAKLLEQNLKDEQAMLRDGKTITRRLAGQAAKGNGGTTGTRTSRTGRTSTDRSSSTRRPAARRSARSRP